MVVSKPDRVVRLVFRQRFEEIKLDLVAGRIKFFNSPEVWEPKPLNLTALNCTLLLLAEEAKWN